MRYIKKSGNLSIEIDGEKHILKCEYNKNKWIFNVNARRAIILFAKGLITKMMTHLGFEVRSIVINIES